MAVRAQMLSARQMSGGCPKSIRSGCSCVRRRRTCELPANGSNVWQQLAEDRQVTPTTPSSPRPVETTLWDSLSTSADVSTRGADPSRLRTCEDICRLQYAWWLTHACASRLCLDDAQGHSPCAHMERRSAPRDDDISGSCPT